MMGACGFTRKDYSEEHAVVFTRRYDVGERKIKIEKVLEYLYELEIALEEIQRVTKPQSFILITTDKVGLV